VKPILLNPFNGTKLATSNTFSQILDSAFDSAGNAHHRQLIWLSGDQAWCYQQLLSVAKQPSQVSRLLVANKSHIDSIEGIAALLADFSECVAPKDCYKFLGSQRQLIIYDGYSGINPDSLAQISGTLMGGGVLVIITPDIDNWDTWPESELDQLWVQPFNVNDVSRNFLNWLKQCLITEKQVMKHSQRQLQESQNPSVHHQSVPCDAIDDALLKRDSALTKHCVNPLALKDQQIVVNNLAHHLLNAQGCCGVLTAARGRGKSAALGLLINELRSQTKSQLDIYLTASDRNAIGQVESFSDLPVQFCHITQLVKEDITHRKSVLIIDEAASISVEVLLDLVKKFSHVVLSTTTQGYEGTGQGFKLRFLQRLTQRNIPYLNFSLLLPMRWSQGDPLEKWLNHLLFLDHADTNRQSPTVESSRNSFVISQLRIEKVSGEQLIDDPLLLQNLFSLLSQAHYRTTPSDLRIILDSPNMHLWLGFDESSEEALLVAACLVAMEGRITEFAKDQQGMEGESLALAMFKGLRRPRGNLLPQILIGQEGYIEAKELKIARVVRVATRVEYRNQGVAGNLLKSVRDWAAEEGCDYLAANFSLEKELLAFWHKQQFYLVRVGSQLDPITASFSATVMMALTTHNQLLKHLKQTFSDRLEFCKLRVFEGNLPLETLEILDELSQIKLSHLSAPQQIEIKNDSIGWYREQLACFAYYHRPLASVAYIFVMLFKRYPHCWLSAHLSAKQRELLKDYFFSEKSMQKIYKQYSLANYKALQKEFRLITKSLLKNI
jgi:tRNA(Met) cytidine acetyltransferase